MARIISNNEIEYQVDEGGNEESREEGEAAARNRMKKGPWTPYEDSILMDYVSRYGEGNWNSVQKNSGLSRCGKSCRLRWANHLRPNLKKGAFSDEEEDIIIQLHSKLGNKWAQMAAQLPGRTDNEIKNFWNTRLKRRQRAGLPIYPPQVQDNEEKQPNFSTSSSPSFSMLLASCYPKKPDEPTHFSSLIPLPTPPDKNHNNDNHACYTNPGSGNKNANLVLPLSPYYGSSSSSSTNFFFNNQSGPATNFTIPLALGSKSTEVSSSQSPPGSATPDSSSSGMGSAALLSPQGNNSGLLDAVVIEAQGLSRNNDKSKCDEDSTFARKKSSHKRKSIIELEEEYGGNKEESLTALLFESTSKSTADTTTQTQTGGGGEEALVNCYWGMDDDLFSLLNNFPSQTPTPEWYRRGGGSSTQSLGLESQAAAGSGPTTADFAWTLATPDHA